MTQSRKDALQAQHDEKLAHAKTANKEGAGTHRNAGDCGLIGAEVMRLKSLIAECDAAISAETIAQSSSTHADALRRLADR